MKGLPPSKTASTRCSTAAPSNIEGDGSNRLLRLCRRIFVTVPLGLALSVLALGACSSDLTELDLDIDFAGGASESSYDALYTGTGTVTLWSNDFEVVCSQPVEATLGIYESNGFGRLSLSYLQPNVYQVERTREERDAGVERVWACADSEALQSQENSYTTTAVVDGQYVFDMEDEFMSLYTGIFEVVVTSGGASLSGQLAAGPHFFDFSVESLSLTE